MKIQLSLTCKTAISRMELIIVYLQRERIFFYTRILANNLTTEITLLLLFARIATTAGACLNLFIGLLRSSVYICQIKKRIKSVKIGSQKLVLKCWHYFNLTRSLHIVTTVENHEFLLLHTWISALIPCNFKVVWKKMLTLSFFIYFYLCVPVV